MRLQEPQIVLIDWRSYAVIDGKDDWAIDYVTTTGATGAATGCTLACGCGKAAATS
ncbi:MAG: hypothetical protein ACP5O7_02575 [Phycisphaerae bacterium]